MFLNSEKKKRKALYSLSISAFSSLSPSPLFLSSHFTTHCSPHLAWPRRQGYLFLILKWTFRLISFSLFYLQVRSNKPQQPYIISRYFQQDMSRNAQIGRCMHRVYIYIYVYKLFSMPVRSTSNQTFMISSCKLRYYCVNK